MKKNFILKSALCLTLAASILTMGACKSTGDNGDTTSASGDEQAVPSCAVYESSPASDFLSLHVTIPINFVFLSSGYPG